MARNKEKQLGLLNRLHLHQQQLVQEKKNPRRPPLCDLHCAGEIRQWMPHILNEMDFCLKQAQVPCYTDAHVQEYRDKVEVLQREYKKHMRKLKT